MRDFRGLALVESCLGCDLARKGHFCDLDSQLLSTWARGSFSRIHHPGEILFRQGDQPVEVLVICAGRVKLTVSTYGRVAICGIARAGDVLAVGDVLSGASLSASAEVTERTHVRVMDRVAFGQFVDDSWLVMKRAATQLIRENRFARQRCIISAQRSAVGKIACFLLLNSIEDAGGKRPSRISLDMSHREVGELIGMSRETVSRCLRSLVNKGSIEVRGSTVRIVDVRGLESSLS